MTNKEKYKLAFSVLHSSRIVSMEEERMMIMKKKARFQAAAAAIAVCLAFAGGGSIAYAADLGGIQWKVQVWIHGDPTDADLIYNPEGTYSLSFQTKDGSVESVQGGGVAIEADGSERPLSKEELLDELDQPMVEYNEDGTVWVYYRDQKMDITDQFKDGICYVKISNGGETLYMTVKYQDGWSTSPHKYVEPNALD